MKRILLVLLIVVSSMVFADLKSDDISNLKPNVWAVFAMHDDFGDETHNFLLASSEPTEIGNKGIFLTRTGTGYYETNMVLGLPSEYEGIDSKFITIRVKVGDRVINDDDVVIAYKDVEAGAISLDFEKDVYKTIIDDMGKGLPLKVYMRPMLGDAVLFYADNTNFKEKYNAIQTDYIKYFK